ncbi:MAG: hypothetical protein ACK4VK_00780 [Aquificaceae bacterium]
MPHLTIDVLQLLEEKLGKEEAKKVAEAIEIALESIEERSKEVALQRKLELREELTKELITKAEFYGEIGLLRQEIQALKIELEAKIEKEILRLDRKFTIMFLILLFVIIFLNKEALEFIAKLLGLIK